MTVSAARKRVAAGAAGAFAAYASVVRPRIQWLGTSTWGFFLRPTVNGQTRLVVPGKARGKPHALIAAGNWLFWDRRNG